MDLLCVRLVRYPLNRRHCSATSDLPGELIMKRIIGVLLLTICVFVSQNATAQAEEAPSKVPILSEKLTTPLTTQEVDKVIKKLSKPVEKPIVEYTIVANDSLTKVAKSQKSTVQRLWEKNTGLTNPDVIPVGTKIIIPKDDEVLIPRSLPTPVLPHITSQSGGSPPNPTPQTTSVNKVQPRGAVAGNTYSYGYCTWYVKNRRPDLPNNLGNADTWTIRARAQGIPTGRTARPGAVGQQGMHVVYVESVNGNMMTISEMNYKGWNIRSTRTTSTSGWNFIY